MKHLFMLTLLLWNIPCDADMHTACSMESVQKLVEDQLVSCDPKDILVLFDVDMTLIQPKDPLLGMVAMVRHKEILRHTLQPLSAHEKTLLLNLIVCEGNMQLVEKATPHVVQALQNQDIPCFALTASMIGALENVKCLEETRFQTLKQFGMDFRGVCKIQMDGLYKGILFSQGHSKGNILREFLQIWGRIPR